MGKCLNVLLGKTRKIFSKNVYRDINSEFL